MAISNLDLNVSVELCPACGRRTVAKFGRTAKGTQRYQCKECNRTFTLESIMRVLEDSNFLSGFLSDQSLNRYSEVLKDAATNEDLVHLQQEPYSIRCRLAVEEVTNTDIVQVTQSGLVLPSRPAPKPKPKTIPPTLWLAFALS